MSTTHAGWLLACCFVLVLVASCDSTGAGKGQGKLRRGESMLDDEAYVLPPLSAFEAFPEEITAQVTQRCAAADFELLELKRTKGAQRQSVFAKFGGSSSQADDRDRVLAAMTVMGRNFDDVARVVLEFSGNPVPRYFVVPGSRLHQYLGLNLAAGDAPLSADELWRTVEYEITPENAAESSTVSKNGYGTT